MSSGASFIRSAGIAFFVFLRIVLGIQMTIKTLYVSRLTGRVSNVCMTILGTEIALCSEHGGYRRPPRKVLSEFLVHVLQEAGEPEL